MGYTYSHKPEHNENLKKRNRSWFTLLFTLALITFIPNSSLSFQNNEEFVYMERFATLLPYLATGDLIFRKSESLTGQFVSNMDSRGEFSHVGIIRLSDEKDIFVVHASPHGKETQNMVQVATLEYFLSFSQEIAIYRPRSTYKQTAIQAANYAFSLAGEVPFDRAFNLETEDAVYCTELIWRAFLEAGEDIVDNNLEELEMPFFGINEYIFPSNLMNEKYFYLFYP